MTHLRMYWFPTTELPETSLPKGYSISRFDPKKDVQAWCECLRGGNLIDGRSDGRAFGEEILDFKDIDPKNDIFFLDFRGEHIGTATAFVHKSTNVGDMHQVGIRADFRGKGLSKHLIRAVQTTLRGRGVRCTDPKNPSNEVLPSYSKGNPEIPESTYRRLREFPEPEMNRAAYEKLGRR